MLYVRRLVMNPHCDAVVKGSQSIAMESHRAQLIASLRDVYSSFFPPTADDDGFSSTRPLPPHLMFSRSTKAAAARREAREAAAAAGRTESESESESASAAAPPTTAGTAESGKEGKAGAAVPTEREERGATARRRFFRRTAAYFVPNASGDAFFYPQRVLAAWLVSNVVIVFFFINFITMGKRLASKVAALSRKTLGTIFTYTTQIEEAYYFQQYADMTGADEQWAYTQARAAHSKFMSLSRAIDVGFTIAACLGYVIFLFTWFVFIVDFRMLLMSARRGRFPHLKKCPLKGAAGYTGAHISASIVTFFLTSILLACAFVPLSWPLFWRLIWDLIKRHWITVLVVLAPSVINAVVKMQLMKRMVGPNFIANRGAWALWEIYSLVGQLLNGIAKGVMRFVISVVVSVFAVARVERTPIAAWVFNLYPKIDGGTSKVHAMIHLTHCHNAPCFRVAAWLMEAGVQTARRWSTDSPPPSYSFIKPPYLVCFIIYISPMHPLSVSVNLT